MSEHTSYKASIEHSAETIEKLYVTQYHTYEKYMILAKTIFAFGILIAGFLTDIPTWARALIIFIGTLVIATRDLRPQLKADKVKEVRSNSFPDMEYEFFKDNFRLSGEGQMSMNYKKLTRLVHDKGYFYLFISPESVCMIDKSTVKPYHCDKFMEFISERTGLSWELEKSFMFYSIYDIIKIFKDRKQR